MVAVVDGVDYANVLGWLRDDRDRDVDVKVDDGCSLDGTYVRGVSLNMGRQLSTRKPIGADSGRKEATKIRSIGVESEADSDVGVCSTEASRAWSCRGNTRDPVSLGKKPWI
jgi:hypothetical protein